MDQNQILLLSDYPRAILHIDGDAFFASIEQQINPKYQGKPVVTGAERGIIAAASYEAKRLGIKRGIQLREALKICPNLIVLPTDYETCSLFSKNMFDIMREFSPIVEEYSIDEAFLDLTGLRRIYHCSYENIAKKIQTEIHRRLGITVSCGLSLTKSLAKICSDFRKPNGFTAVPGKYLHILLQKVKIEDVWGIGKNTTALLSKYSIKTAYDYINLSENFIQQKLGKTGIEIFRELRGEYIYKVTSETKNSYQSISKFKTFTPEVRNKDKVKAFLIRNMESACIKARRYNLEPLEISIVLRTKNFEHYGATVKLSRRSNHPLELAEIISKLFETIYRQDTYRATGIIFSKLETKKNVQRSLFEDTFRIEKIEKTSKLIDALNKKFGKHTLHLGGSLQAKNQHIGKRALIPLRKEFILRGESKRKKLMYPMQMISI